MGDLADPIVKWWFNDSAISRTLSRSLKRRSIFQRRWFQIGMRVNGAKIIVSATQPEQSGDLLHRFEILEFILELPRVAYDDQIHALPKEFDPPVEF